MFSNSTKYAIRTVIYLAHNQGTQKYTVVELAGRLDIPKPFLSKILQQLSRSDIISSTKGRGGGFYMTEKNLQKQLIDVITCIEGYNVFDKCILGLPDCNNSNPCFLHSQFSKFKNGLNASLNEHTLKELIEQEGDQIEAIIEF